MSKGDWPPKRESDICAVQPIFIYFFQCEIFYGILTQKEIKKQVLLCQVITQTQIVVSQGPGIFMFFQWKDHYMVSGYIVFCIYSE